MRKQKVYVETTLFNYYFDTERDAHPATIALFKEIAAGKYEAFTSEYVADELNNASEEKRDKMMSLLKEYRITVLAKSEESEMLADQYVSQGIIPIKFHTDGLHIATAAINDLDMIISLNFKHIVKEKTRMITAEINTIHGYKAIQINSPMEIVEDEDI